jgi:hypothetical protein
MKQVYWWLCLAAVVFAFTPLGVGTTRASSLAGSPSFDGGFEADGGQVLAFIGYDSWGEFIPMTNGSQAYTGALIVVLYDIAGGPIQVNLNIVNLGQNNPQTVQLQPGQPATIQLNLAYSNSWHDATVYVGSSSETFSVAVPVSLLPPSIADTGGLDLLIIGIASEAVIAFTFCFWLARRMMAKAMYAPKFSLIIWGHVILIALAAFVILNFQWVDQTFAGMSPLVYVASVSPMVWAFALSLFNQAPAALVLRANAPLAGRLSFHAWYIRTAVDPKGRTVLIDPSWRGFWARTWGHNVVLVPEEARITQPEPFVADVIHKKVLTREQLIKRIRRPSVLKASPLDDFEVIPANVDGRPSWRESVKFVKLYFTPVGEPVEVSWPHLSIRHEVEVPAVYDEQGTVSVPAHHENRLTMPHYTDGSATLKIHLIHFRSQQSVVAGWRSSEDLATVLSDTSLDLEALKANFEARVAKIVNERLVARATLLGRAANDLDENEAAEESQRTNRGTLPDLDELTRNRLVSDLDPRDRVKPPRGGRRGDRR